MELVRRFVSETAAGCVLIHAIEVRGPVTADGLFIEMSVFGVFRERTLQLMPPSPVARLLDRAFKLAQASFFLIHGLEDTVVTVWVQAQL